MSRTKAKKPQQTEPDSMESIIADAFREGRKLGMSEKAINDMVAEELGGAQLDVVDDLLREELAKHPR